MGISKKKSKRVSKAGFNPSKAVEQVTAIAKSLQASGVSQSERKVLYATAHHVSDALIESVANLAAQHGGTILGVPFDVEEANAVLAYAKGCKAVIDSTRSFAQRLKDDVLLRRKAVAERAQAVYGAMSRLVRTPEGKHLVQSFEQMHAQVTRVRRARKSAAKRAAAAATEPAVGTAGAQATTATASSPAAGVVTH